MTPERLGLLWGITVFAGAFARLFSSFTGFPSVVILLLSGLFIGRSGLGFVGTGAVSLSCLLIGSQLAPACSCAPSHSDSVTQGFSPGLPKRMINPGMD